MQLEERERRGLCGWEERGVVRLNPPNGLAIVDDLICDVSFFFGFVCDFV